MFAAQFRVYHARVYLFSDKMPIFLYLPVNYTAPTLALPASFGDNIL